MGWRRSFGFALILASACQPEAFRTMKERPVPNLDWEPPSRNAPFVVQTPMPSPRPLVIATSGRDDCPLLLLFADGLAFSCRHRVQRLVGRVEDPRALHARFAALDLLSAPPVTDVVPSDADSPGMGVCVSREHDWVCVDVGSMWPGRPREEHEAAARGAPIPPPPFAPGELAPPPLTVYTTPAPEPMLAANDLLLSLDVEWAPTDTPPPHLDYLRDVDTAHLRAMGLVIK
ncbi:MAG: hypothetical protein SangKO_054500 [Sandaracinaceae bacterium]